jgi:hypothetical protein
MNGFKPDTCNYRVDIEHRKTEIEINKIKTKWENSKRYFRIETSKTTYGFSIEGYRKVQQYII